MFIIGGIDEVVQQLEENQIDLSAMLGHRYVSGIRKVDYQSFSPSPSSYLLSLLPVFLVVFFFWGGRGETWCCMDWGRLNPLFLFDQHHYLSLTDVVCLLSNFLFVGQWFCSSTFTRTFPSVFLVYFVGLSEMLF